MKIKWISDRGLDPPLPVISYQQLRFFFFFTVTMDLGSVTISGFTFQNMMDLGPGPWIV
jgi:hypothetical protein